MYVPSLAIIARLGNQYGHGLRADAKELFGTIGLCWMNFFGICGATISPYLSGVIAEATGAFVAPLELAVAIMLVASTTMIVFFRVRPLSELVGAPPLPASERLPA